MQLGVTNDRPEGLHDIEEGLVITSNAADNSDSVIDAGDYRLNAMAGIIEFIKDPGANALHAFYKTTAKKRNRVIPGSAAVRGALKFVQDNAYGINRVYTFPLVEMRGNGDIALIGDEWQTVPMTFTATKHPSAAEVMYVDSLATRDA